MGEMEREEDGSSERCVMMITYKNELGGDGRMD